MPNHQTICTILAELWINHREEEDFETFCKYNDVGLPLAYFLSEGLVPEIAEDGQKYVIETFDLLLAALDIKQEEVLDDMTLSDLFKIVEDRR